MSVADGELVAAIGDNRKMLVFPIEQVPEMTRGRGVRLQRYKDGGLSDVKVFRAEIGLTWKDLADRGSRSRSRSSPTGAAIAAMPAAWRRKAFRAATSSNERAT